MKLQVVIIVKGDPGACEKFAGTFRELMKSPELSVYLKEMIRKFSTLDNFISATAKRGSVSYCITKI